MTATKALGTYGNAVGVVTPADHKAALSGLIAKTALNAVRPGLFWGGNASVIVGKANMSYDVIAFTAALSRGSTSGTVILSNDGTLNVATTAAPGSNSRIDIIYVWAREYSLDGVDSNPVIGVTQGIAAAVPVAPSLAAFPGAIELGRATVGAGITATTSATLTQTAPFTCVDGGRIPFRNTTERDAGTYVEGQLGWLIDTDQMQVYNGTTWSPLALSGTVPIVPTSVTLGGVGSTSIGTNGKITVTGAGTSISVNGCFTAAYTNYDVIIKLTPAAANILTFRLRTSAPADESGNYYDAEGNYSEAGTPGVVTNSAQNVWALGTSALKHTVRLLLTDPSVAAPTDVIMSSHDWNPVAGSARTSHIGLGNKQSTSYAGFTILLSASTVTGSITIKGHND